MRVYCGKRPLSFAKWFSRTGIYFSYFCFTGRIFEERNADTKINPHAVGVFCFQKRNNIIYSYCESPVTKTQTNKWVDKIL